MNRVTRLFRLHQALLDGRPIYNAQQWALHFKVDTRTLRRDLSFLKKETGALLYDANLKGYRYETGKVACMSDKPSKWARLFTLIHRIAAEPGRTASQLAKATGMSERTIYRDLRELEDSGFPIYNDNGYRFAADAFLPKVRLEPKELFSLFVAVRVLEAQHQDGLGADARRALEKLLRATAEAERPDLASMRDTIAVSEPSEDTGVSWLDGLQAALASGCQLKLLYQGMHDTQAKERTVDPLGLFCHRQVWYLHAYDHLPNGLRNFRLSRVTDLEQLETPVVHDAKLQLDSATYHRWDVAGETAQEVELKVTPELARWLTENPVHPSQRIDGVSATYQVTDPSAMARWVASLYGLEVVRPESLRREMAKIADELQGLYGAE